MTTFSGMAIVLLFVSASLRGPYYYISSGRRSIPTRQSFLGTDMKFVFKKVLKLIFICTRQPGATALSTFLAFFEATLCRDFKEFFCWLEQCF
jgi:hypothetical protein